jgi:uncharacterized protein YjbJ (UPF0337 family)
MNSDELKGKLENLKGRAKEAFGSLSGNKKAEAEGLADRVEGAAREKVGEAKEEVDRRRASKAEENIEETDDE